MPDYTRFDPANPPPPLMTGESNSFANYTMTTRIPSILMRVLEDHQQVYPPEIIAGLQVLHTELVANQPLRPLETTAQDRADWAEAWQAHQGRRWLNIPWYFAETFFYRRLLESTNYFGGNGAHLADWTGVDPFLPQKQAELNGDAPWKLLAAALDALEKRPAAGFQAVLHYAVWGNRADLSYIQVAQSRRQISVESEQENLLVDDTGAVLAYLEQEETSTPQPPATPTPHVSPNGRRIDFICDNAGAELLLDLVLADFLLRFEWAGQVRLHVKAHPTFVSDATPADVNMTIAALTGRAEPSFQALAGRLEDFRRQNRLRVRPHLFWNSSHFFWELPPELRAELAQASLLIFKGDANYRRLLGDSRWPAAVPIAGAIPYLPTSFVALRTMKSDPIVGLQPGQAEQLDREDPEWRVNGKRGIIQALLFNRAAS